MGYVLCAGTQMEHGKKLCARVDGQPEPQHVSGAAKPGAQFVQLEVREPESGGRSARAGFARAHQHGIERLVIVARRKPKTRSAAEGSNPSASARSAPLRSDERGFSDGIRECCAWK